MVAFGPLSSVFDILTFAGLFWVVCPAVAGGAWGALDAAGQALFVGRVRRHNHGRDVVAVEYDLFEPLARSTFEAIARESLAEVTPELRVYVAHAHGRLDVGDIAVVVAAGSRHRDEAFRACRAVIEGVKHRAPIWKREHYREGDADWLHPMAEEA